MGESVYENYSKDFADQKDAVNSSEDAVPEPQFTRSIDGTISEQKSSGYRCYRLAVVCLTVLVILLLVAIAILWFKLTSERDQMQTGHNNITTQREQLETNCKNKGDQLQRKVDELQQKFSQLKKNIDTKEWQYFRSSIYYISTEGKSWSESRQDCKERGADLVIINSIDEQDFIGMFRRMKEVWIGANDRETETAWKWVDNTTVSNGFWKQGEPNNVGEEDCAVSGYRNEMKNWYDVSCDRKYFWICEKMI